MSALLAFASSLAWGSSDFIAGEQARRVGTIVVTWWLQVTGVVLLAVAWFTLHATGHVQFSDRPFLIGAAAGTCGIIGLAAFYRALAIGPMSLVAPITAMSVVIPATWGLITGSTPSSLALGGMVAIVVGIVLVSRPPRDDHADAVRATPTVIMLSMFAAVWFGVFQTMLDVAGNDDPIAAGTAVLGVRVGGFSLICLVCAVTLIVPWQLDRAAVRVGGVGAARARVYWLVAAGAFDALANALYAIAAATGNFAIVAVLGALYPALTVLLAGLILHERMVTHQFIGIAAALGGVAVLAAGG